MHEESAEPSATSVFEARRIHDNCVTTLSEGKTIAETGPEVVLARERSKFPMNKKYEFERIVKADLGPTKAA
jgi:hypothetical protein